MELDSPANGFGELNDLLKEDEPSLTDELHPSYAVNKEENTAEYDFDNLASSNNILVDLAQHEQENPLTMHNEFPYYEFSESPKKFLSPSQTGVDGSVLDETKFVSDEDRLLSSPLKYYHQEETEDLSSSYPSRSSFEHEQVPMHDDIEAEVSGHLLESFTRKGPIEEQEMKDKPASSSHEGMVGETTFDMMKYDLMISEIAGKELEEEPIDLQTETEDRPASSSQEGMVEETSFTKMKYDLDTSQIADKELGEEVTDPPCEKSHTSPISSVENVEIKIEKACYAKDSSVEEVTDPAGILHTYPKSPVDNVETEGGQGFHSEDHPPAHVRELEMPHFDQLTPDRGVLPSKSPDRGSQMSPHAYLSHDSPKATSSQQDLQDLLYSSRSHRQKHGSLAENPEDLLLSDEQIPVSPGASQRGRRHADDSYVKHIPASRGNHNSRPKHQRQDRSVSKSPVRLKESSSRHNREHRERSRSRPPDESVRHRRSPRRRYSPRRRSPRSDYHSHRRSPRRRQWSPPHNRSTGLGKPGRNLFVAGFSFLTTERDLERKFSRFGRVRDVRIVRDKRSGDSRGFGFLTLERDEEADAAIRALDKTEWNGRVVLVEKSKPH